MCRYSLLSIIIILYRRIDCIIMLLCEHLHIIYYYINIIFEGGAKAFCVERVWRVQHMYKAHAQATCNLHFIIRK